MEGRRHPTTTKIKIDSMIKEMVKNTPAAGEKRRISDPPPPFLGRSLDYFYFSFKQTQKSKL